MLDVEQIAQWSWEKESDGEATVWNLKARTQPDCYVIMARIVSADRPNIKDVILDVMGNLSRVIVI